MNEKTAVVTLAAEIGGPDADKPTLHAHSELRRLLRVHCVEPYSPDVDEFAPILRIEGSITKYKPGLEHLRRSFKERYITIDIGVPRKCWENRTEREIREHFVHMVKEALKACINRLKKDKTPVDGEALMRDYEKAAKEYLRDV